MGTKDLNVLDSLMEKAIKRFTPTEISKALDRAVEQSKEDDYVYIETLYDALIGRWAIDGIMEPLADFKAM